CDWSSDVCSSDLEIDRARAAPIAPAVIRDEPDAFATNEVERVGDEHLDARNHVAGAGRCWPRGRGRRARRTSERSGETREREAGAETQPGSEIRMRHEIER